MAKRKNEAKMPQKTLLFEHWLPPALPLLLPTYHLHPRTPPSFLPSQPLAMAQQTDDPCEKVSCDGPEA